MKIVLRKSPTSNQPVAPGVSLLECQKLIFQNVKAGQFADYLEVMDQIQQGQPLKKIDLGLLDYIDKLTLTLLGTCIKDAKSTRARLNACADLGIKFEDHGGLIDHMHMVESAQNN